MPVLLYLVNVYLMKARSQAGEQNIGNSAGLEFGLAGRAVLEIEGDFGVTRAED